jgi:hypothetical protein
LAKLTDALDAPFVRLIEGDSGAVKALNDLRTRRFVASDATEALRQDAPLADRRHRDNRSERRC